MAQWMRVLVSKPGNSSSMPRCHIVEREKGLSQVVLETPVLIISPAEALNGQYLGRRRQFKKTLWLVLLVSQV